MEKCLRLFLVQYKWKEGGVTIFIFALKHPILSNILYDGRGLHLYKKPNEMSVAPRQKAFCMTSLLTVSEHGKSVRNSPHDTNTVCHFESIWLRFQARPLKWLPCVRVEGRGRSRRVCFVWELLAALWGFLKARKTWRHPKQLPDSEAQGRPGRTSSWKYKHQI